MAVSAIMMATRISALGVLVAILNSEEGYTMEQLRTERVSAANRTRRILYNNDGHENLTDVPITPQTFLDARTTGVETTQVDTIIYCTGLTVMHTHRTEIGDRFGYNGLGDERWSFPAELDTFETDSLELQEQYVHEHQKEVFWSLRMNDSHDSALDKDFLRPSWKTRNPEAVMGEPGDTFPVGGSRWSTLNYALPLVRDYIFSIIEEVCLNYDIDGIELDFFRHPLFFKEVMMGGNASPESIQMMTDLIRRIRTMTEEIGFNRQCPILLSIKIPDSMDYCLGIGLDVRSWLQEGLVDMLVGTGYFKLEPWTHFVAWGHQYHVPVYAAFEARSIIPSAYIGDVEYEIKRFRGAALNAWNAGVDGVYTYNLWFSPQDEYTELFDQLGDPDLLRTIDRVDGESFVFSDVMPPQTWLVNGNDYVQQTDENLVLNQSFESLNVTSEKFYFGMDAGAPGNEWTPDTPGGVDTSILLFTKENPNGVTNGVHGDQYAVLTGRKATTNDYGVPNLFFQQVMGEGTAHDIVSVGDSLFMSVSLANVIGTPKSFRFGLYRDSSLTTALVECVSSEIAPVWLSPTGFQEYGLQWTAGTDDIGESVYIGFSSEDYGISASGSPRLGIDNVRLVMIPKDE